MSKQDVKSTNSHIAANEADKQKSVWKKVRRQLHTTYGKIILGTLAVGAQTTKGSIVAI